MSWAEWFVLSGIFILGAMSPGPSLAVVVRHSLVGGRAAGLAAAVAHGLGIGIYAALSVVGIGALMRAWPGVVLWVQWMGAVFLLYLAYSAGRSAWRVRQGVVEPPATALQQRQAWRDGFLIAFLNPKVALFFVALFTQFLSPEHDLWTKAAVAVLAMSIDTLWYVCVAFLLSATVARQRFFAWRVWIEAGFALLLLLIAVPILVQVIRGITVI